MRELIFYNTNYDKIHTEAGFSALLSTNSFDKDKETLKLDLPRSCYFSQQYSIEQLKQQILDRFHQPKENAYLQGDLMAGFPKLLQSHRFEVISRSSQNYSNHPIFNADSIPICYTTDTGDIYSMMIYIEKSIHNQSDNYHFVVAIYKSVYKNPSDRFIALIGDKDILPESFITHGETISDPSYINQFLNEHLQNSLLCSIVRQLFDDKSGKISKKRFDLLQSQISVNTNLYEVWFKNKHHDIQLEKAITKSFWAKNAIPILKTSISILAIIIACTASFAFLSIPIALSISIICVITSLILLMRINKYSFLLFNNAKNDNVPCDPKATKDNSAS